MTTRRMSNLQLLVAVATKQISHARAVKTIRARNLRKGTKPVWFKG